MSQSEERIETILDEKKETKRRNRRSFRWHFRILLLVLIVGLAAAFVSVRLFSPKTYTATAWIQVLSQKPHFVFGENDPWNDDKFARTQFALMRSPLIIEKTLENPEVARTKTIASKKDRSAWLAGNLKLQTQIGSEMITVSLTTRDPRDSEIIVNAVIGAYFQYHDAQRREWNAKLITRLTLELNRQQSAARLLQNEIRSRMEAAAQKVGTTGDILSGFVPGELLLKDIYATEAKLDALRAERKMLEELRTVGQQAPPATVRRAVERDPTVKQTANTLTRLNVEEQAMKAVLPDVLPDGNPKRLELREKIESTEKQLALLREAVKREITDDMEQALAVKLEEDILIKEQEVRTTEILLENLRQRYREQLQNAGERTVMVTDVSFQQDQLKRVNAVLDKLSDRIVALQTEMNAPDQIQLRKKATVPPSPDPPKNLWKLPGF